MLAIEPPTAAVLRERMVEAVREAGVLARERFRRPVKVWHKVNASPVTEADIAANIVLRGRLMAAAPAYGWLSEESEDNLVRLASKRVWIVDPIDGTRAFIAGLPDWAVSAALVEDGRPILAALFAPIEDSLFVAAAGEGATCNAAPLRASRGTSLDGIRVAGPRRQLEALASVAPSIRTVPRIHSLALRVARVAEGALDAAFASGSGHDWDLAAADLLVHEAGGALTTLGGERLHYNRADTAHGSVVAAGRERHKALLDVIAMRPRNFL